MLGSKWAHAHQQETEVHPGKRASKFEDLRGQVRALCLMYRAKQLMWQVGERRRMQLGARCCEIPNFGAVVANLDKRMTLAERRCALHFKFWVEKWGQRYFLDFRAEEVKLLH